MGSSKPSVERIDTSTDEQAAQIKALNEATGGMLDEMMQKLGYNIQGDQSYQAGTQALNTQLSEFDPNKIASNFEQYIAAPARTTFQEQTIPGIAERYSGRGSAGQVALRDAATNFEKSLGAEKSNALLTAEQQKETIRSQAINQALSYAQAPGQEALSQLQTYLQSIGISLTPQFQPAVQEGSSGAWPSLIQAGGTIAGAAVGGAGGAAVGNAAAKAIT